jgi:hypothetical protein
MYRKLMRWALLAFIVLAAAYTVWPSLAGAVGISFPVANQTSAAAPKVSAGPCSNRGVTLVIDYGDANGRPASTTCVDSFGESAGDTGWGLFAAAGQSVEGTADYPSGFACRINGFPSHAEASCANTANLGNGRWAYFRAYTSSGWQYSRVGASMAHPLCGGWEGWRYVSNSDTKVSPPRVSPRPFKCS